MERNLSFDETRVMARDMSIEKQAHHLPPQVVKARFEAWASLVDTGVAGMIALQRKLHPDRDPMPYVREAIRRQSEDSHQANIRMLRRAVNHGE